jgi:hypothetical protein
MTDWEKPEESKVISDWQFAFLVVMAVLAVIAVASLPVRAMTITMSNPGGLSERDIIAYFPNGTMQGFYNSTSIITLDANSSYIFTLKPLATNPLTDPTDWLVNDAFPFAQTYAIPVILISFFIWLAFGRC